MGQAYRLVRPQVTVTDIIAIKDNPNIRLTSSPFGLTAEEAKSVVYVGKAAPWKGKKGSAFWKAAEGHGNLATGLRNAIAISKRAAGTKGTAWMNGRLYPKKCLVQMGIKS